MHLAHVTQESPERPFVFSTWATPGDDSANVAALVKRRQGKTPKVCLVSNIVISVCPVQKLTHEMHHLQCSHFHGIETTYKLEARQSFSQRLDTLQADSTTLVGRFHDVLLIMTVTC